jgi:3-oxoacyl-[acyl-carrier-protein] synthase III
VSWIETRGTERCEKRQGLAEKGNKTAQALPQSIASKQEIEQNSSTSKFFLLQSSRYEVVRLKESTESQARMGAPSHMAIEQNVNARVSTPNIDMIAARSLVPDCDRCKRTSAHGRLKFSGP